jgi:Uma2 family endonuclease
VATTTKKPWTADELGRLPQGWRYEIDEGELVIMSPAGRRHSRTVMEIGRRLGNFVRDHGLGEVDGGEFGVYVRREPPQILRGLDVAYYSQQRLARMGADDEGFPDVPPDLAVEVHLPDEADMQRKVQQYMEAGVLSVWVVDPRRRTLTQHRPGAAPRTLTDPEAAVEDPVLPGFACRLRELFGEDAPAGR